MLYLKKNMNGLHLFETSSSVQCLPQTVQVIVKPIDFQSQLISKTLLLKTPPTYVLDARKI